MYVNSSTLDQYHFILRQGKTLFPAKITVSNDDRLPIFTKDLS